MRTTVTLRAVAAGLLAGGTLVAAAAGTSASAATVPTYAEGNGDGKSGSPIWGTVVSGTALNVRAEPTSHSTAVDRLAPGSQDRVQCKVRGQRVNGNPYWYWLVGSEGWASAAFVDTDGRRVPTCSDPCPQWRDGEWSNADWNDPDWSEPWAVSGSLSWTFSGSFDFQVTSGSSSDGWGPLPVVW